MDRTPRRGAGDTVVSTRLAGRTRRGDGFWPCGWGADTVPDGQGGAHSAFCRQLPAASLFEDPAARGTACGRHADGHQLRSGASPSVGAVIPLPCQLTAEPLPRSHSLPPLTPHSPCIGGRLTPPPPRPTHPPIGRRFTPGEASQRSGEGRLSAETRRSANRKQSGGRSVGCGPIFLLPVLLPTLLAERPVGR